MKKILIKLNSPTPADIWQMRQVVLRYNLQCLHRFHKGEMFYPRGLGLSRCDYEWTIQRLLGVLSSVQDTDVILLNKLVVCKAYFNLNFSTVPIWEVDWQYPYFINNYWELDEPFFVYEVVGVQEKIIGGRKLRSILIKGLDKEITVDSAFYLKKYTPFLCDIEDEPRLYKQFQCSDWRLKLARALTTTSTLKDIETCSNGHSKVLPFKPSAQLRD
tara:strand:- start:1702 stop:2349 length:648 start_codon:yes stop_codon:yes gene_type:complete